MTPAEAQEEIRSIAEEPLAEEGRLRRVWRRCPGRRMRTPMFEGRMAWDLATEIRTVVECVGEDLRGVESLERVMQVP